jgi:hypothetical protein
MSLNNTADNNFQKNKGKNKPSLENKHSVFNKSGKKRKFSEKDLFILKSFQSILTKANFSNFSIQKNKVQIKINKNSKNNLEFHIFSEFSKKIFYDAYILSIKGEINFIYEFRQGKWI